MDSSREDETGTRDEPGQQAERQPPPIQKLIGFVVGVILVLLAQRDLRKRSPELVRGRTGVWRVVAMVPPGAVAYLIFGRRRRSTAMETIEAIVLDESIAA